MTLAMTGIAVPTFVTAPFLALVFGLYLRWLPVAGWGGGAVRYMVLPVIALSLPKIGVIARLTRGAMLEVMRSNHVRTARSKGTAGTCRRVAPHAAPGLAADRVLSRPAIATVMSGSVVIEQIFSLPGIGRSFVEGALNRDYPVVMGITIFYAVIIITLNLLVDIVYRFLDRASGTTDDGRRDHETCRCRCACGARSRSNSRPRLRAGHRGAMRCGGSATTAPRWAASSSS